MSRHCNFKNQREFMATRPVLQKMLNGALYPEVEER